jgi:hypothetical protein
MLNCIVDQADQLECSTGAQPNISSVNRVLSQPYLSRIVIGQKERSPEMQVGTSRNTRQLCSRTSPRAILVVDRIALTARF